MAFLALLSPIDFEWDCVDGGLVDDAGVGGGEGGSVPQASQQR